jgi:C4-type Zn-finger protein
MFVLFGKKKEEKDEKEYVICPKCGAGYNTDMVSLSILARSPFMEDLSSWSTRIVCKNCRAEFAVRGSYRKVFGQRRPG